MLRSNVLSGITFSVAAALAVVGCTAEVETISEESKIVQRLIDAPVANPRVETFAGGQSVSLEFGTKKPNEDDSRYCHTEFGGRVTELGTDFTRVLVRYELPAGGQPTPDVSTCDGGEVFFLDMWQFESMTNSYELKQKFLTDNKRIVDQILANPVANPRTETVAEKKTVGLEPSVDWHNACEISFGGKITELGADGAKTLVRYVRSGHGTRAQCEEGAIFFLDTSLFESTTSMYEVRQRVLTDNKRIVDQILANPVANPRTAYFEKTRQFQTVELEPRTHEYDTCTIERGNGVTELGTHGTKVLVKLTHPIADNLNQCQEGAVFFVDRQHFVSMQ